MPFYNREKEIEEMKAVLSGEPNLVYFVYGPINSGKTAILMKVFEELPEEYRVFYINFRGFEGGYTKFTRVFFELGDRSLWEKIKSKMPIVAAAVEYIEKVAKKVNTAIELPTEVIRMLQVGGDDPEKIDMFHYLEKVMERFVEKGKRPVFVLDEMQVLKGELNASGKPLLGRLFNFLVRLTKEKHLCHSLCATSDCLFIEDVYSNARLEGRAKYILVDDLAKEEAFRIYEEFGFKDKELIWEYIGGKVGDMVSLFEDKKRGIKEEEAVKRMLKDMKGKLRWLFRLIEEGEKENVSLEEIKKALFLFKEREEVDEEEVKGKVLKFLIEENILFYNPVEGKVRPQSRLIQKAIRELV